MLLAAEQNRSLRAEDEGWDAVGRPETLRDQSLRAIARNWRDIPIDFDQLPTLDDRDYLLELLPLDLPFELAIQRIPYEHYWERAAEDR